MGIINNGTRVGVCLVIMSSIFGVSALWAADGSDALDLDYSITSGESGELVWKIKDPTGGNREFSQEETQKLLREVHFPKALINAEAGKAPEVWTIGFFYLDGVATEKNLVTAEAAFRKGLQYDRPDGLLYLASAYHELGLAEKENDEKREKFFWKEGDLHLEVLAAGFESPAAFVIPLAGAYLFGWYDVKKDLSRAETLLNATEKVLPESPLVQLHKAKLRIYQKRYPEAYDYAEKAEKGFLAVRGDHEVIQEEFQKARAAKISAAVLGGQISKVDPEEFMEISKDSLGLNGPMAWAIPVLLLLVLAFLLWRSRRSWKNGNGEGPGLRLSMFWISASILAAGIGFAIRLPGLNNGVGHWIGAILVSVFSILAITSGGWRRYFGPLPISTGTKAFFKGLALIAGFIVAMQLVAMGYKGIYEWVSGRTLDQQLVSLFLKSENLVQLAGTILIVGIAIPFYEEVFFRGFLFDSLRRLRGPRVALVVSSVSFALVHGFAFAVPLLFLSFALGWLRLRTGNLKMSFLLHAANNSCSVLIGYFLSN
jgi:membrane protease YdiL (CAAX protease family)/tetratricopeptide (TPR) repeat protein